MDKKHYALLALALFTTYIYLRKKQEQALQAQRATPRLTLKVEVIE